MINGAKAVVKCLEKEQVPVIFGYPGAAICPFYDELSESGIRHILVRQEQNAGHAASGYARMTGRPGVCVVTSGPGATNLITALATAYMDSIPLIAITGQVSSDLLGRDVFQEVDITGAAEPFTKHSYLLKDAADIPKVFKEAFYIASTGRPGPVLIDLPVDIQKQMIDFQYPHQVSIRGYNPNVKGHVIQIKRVLQAIEEAKRPVICVGGGAFASDAAGQIHAFSEQFQIPVVSTMMGISIMNTDDPLYYGMLGMHGNKCANRAIHDSDLLIIIGARVGDRAVSTPNILAKRTRVVHIDIDPAEIGKNMHTSIPLVGDAATVLEQLCEKELQTDTEEWIELLDELRAQLPRELPEREGYVNPKNFLRLLSEKTGENAVFVADVGQNQIWSANNLMIKNSRFLTTGGMGTMGYSVPAAVGAKLACPDRQVVAVCGDGSFQMQLCELATICQHGVPVKIVVMTNTKLGMVRELQYQGYRANYVGVDLSGSPDFMKLTDAYGIAHRRISGMDEAGQAIDEMLNAEGPYLLECIVDPMESSL
ncbi:biosynthetic-type acetolactate synthase large subunit [Candidatus Soleaferrea massiliensis]|uniref:biosynthetic-type acetolactate synthase large subunit n=1 Tax=Candidatus Soleaferrea massiliensis TaxID=1470354 RepID=UPI00058F9A26|nr:biosynthetic-type acetolactate synthase large subunit [Candidatus Soleaferrea massiliensis]